MVKSLEKFIFKSLYLGNYFALLLKGKIFAQNHKFINKNNYLPAWRDFKINFSRPLFTIIFKPKMVFLNTDPILRVKTMYESVKPIQSCFEKNSELFTCKTNNNQNPTVNPFPQRNFFGCPLLIIFAGVTKS